MNTAAIISTIAVVIREAVTLGPIVIKTAKDAEPFARAIYGVLTGDNITQEKLDELAEKIRALSAQLQEPLPPEDDGA